MPSTIPRLSDSRYDLIVSLSVVSITPLMTHAMTFQRWRPSLDPAIGGVLVDYAHP